MTPLQLIEASGDETIRPTLAPDRKPWPDVVRPPLPRSSAIAVVLSFGRLDRRALRALGDALPAIPMAAREVAVSCDVGVRTFARTLTIRLWALDDRRTRAAVEKLAGSIARAHGVVIVLSGGLAASAALVDEALAASDHAALALAPDDLASALDRARAALWPPFATGDGPEEAACPALPARGWREPVGRAPGQRSIRRGA